MAIPTENITPASMGLKSLNICYLKTPSGILKVLEIICVIVAFSLIRGGRANFKGNNITGTSFFVFNDDAYYFGAGVLVTSLIITPLLLLCYLMGKMEIQKTILEVAFNFLMFLFLLCLGCVTIDFFSRYTFTDKPLKNQSLTLGSFCVISSVLYFVDMLLAALAYKG